MHRFVLRGTVTSASLRTFSSSSFVFSKSRRPRDVPQNDDEFNTDALFNEMRAARAAQRRGLPPTELNGPTRPGHQKRSDFVPGNGGRQVVSGSWNPRRGFGPNSYRNREPDERLQPSALNRTQNRAQHQRANKISPEREAYFQERDERAQQLFILMQNLARDVAIIRKVSALIFRSETHPTNSVVTNEVPLDTKASDS